MFFVGILCAIFVFVVIVSLHELGHMLVAKAFGVGVVEYAIGMGPVLWWKRKGDTVISVRAIPIGGYCAMYGEESLEAKDNGLKSDEKSKRKPQYKTDWTENQQLPSKAWWQRFLIYVAGPAMNVVVAVVASLCLILSSAAMSVPVVDSLMEDYPAESSGIMVGDQIVGVDDREVLSWDDYVEYLTTHPKTSETGYDVHVLRDGAVLTFRATEVAEDGLFGISIRNVPVDMTFRNVISYTRNQVGLMFHSVFDSVGMLVRGDASLSDLTGIIGITGMIAESVDETAEEGGSVFVFVCYIMAFLSVNLFVFNLLPIPALDGGRALMACIEGVIRRRIPKKMEYLINGVGMLFLLGLLGYTMVNDLIRTVFSLFI